MRLTIVALVLCACLCLSAGDVAHLKSAKAKLIGRLAFSKHHKRGVLSAVPPYKLGYDIPVVTHSVVKPVVVSYPPAAAVTNVKVPLSHPLSARYPVPVGHKVPVPHPHYGLKFPHHSKTVLLPKPDHHFHHHHHHVPPKSVIPLVPAHPVAPVQPIEEPIATVAHPVPAPPQVLLHPAPVPAPLPAPVPAPVPIFSAAALSHTHLFPQKNTHFRPVVQYAAPVSAPPTPILQYANQYQYVLRPGNAVQTSFFANYPRFPLLNYQSPGLPFAPAHIPLSPLLYDRQPPLLHLAPQAGQDGVVYEQPTAHVEPPHLHAHGEIPQHSVHLQPNLHLQPAQTGVQFLPHAHLHPGQQEVHLHPGQPEVHLHSGQPEVHLQPGQPEFHLQPDYHLQPGQPEVHLHQGQPEIHSHQGQPEIHLHQGQPEVHLHSAQPGVLQPAQPGIFPTQATGHLQPTLDQDGWHPVQAQPHDQGAAQPGGHFSQEGQFAQGNFGLDGQFGQDGHHHQFTQDQGTQIYEQHTGDQQYHDLQDPLQTHIQQQFDQDNYNNQQAHQQPGQEYGVPQIGQDSFGYTGGQDFSQPGQNFGQQGHAFSDQGQNFGQDFSQSGQSFGNDYSQQQPASEYGVPQGAEGRSSAEGEEEPRFHNHIPLMLQPPLDRPLEHFH